MARPSPAVGRVVAVLNFLAAHPDDGFTLSELARHVDLNKATAHSMLNALADAGYVLRHPTRLIYTLGPALVALGNAVAGSSPAVDFARDEMRALAGRFELECLATTAVADEMVIVARSGVPSRVATVDELVQVGRRLPLVPPLGTVFKAWAGDDEIERWLAMTGGTVTPDELERSRAGLAAARRRGYVVGLEADPRAALGRALAQLADDERAARVRDVVESLVDELGHEDYILVDDRPDTTYFVNHVVAPVFGPDGAVVLALSLYGFRGRLSGRQIERYGTALREACDRVTRSIHGQAPGAAA
ncbi:MAG TPA: helix-turn-helix domain-containing protein [Acidimicrobiia bacterium]|nr:helix-turn-helix domain-containing protein [Acidimicrobiia bacterium]